MGIPEKEIWNRVDESLKAVGMTAYRHASPNRLSGGQKQRVAIAGVMAMRPRCIVLDEPTAMLDPRGRREVMDTVLRLNREKGITVVLITHHMDEAAQAKRVVVLSKGEIALDGKPEAVFSQVDRLHSLGLAAPDTVELCYELNRQGFSLPLDRLDTEECAQILYRELKGSREI
jgi:energy-coupling factor transport system ATP-binding protein